MRLFFWIAGSALIVFVWCCRKISSMLEVDDEGGRMFLRVFIYFIMYNYASFVSGVL